MISHVQTAQKPRPGGEADLASLRFWTSRATYEHIATIERDGKRLVVGRCALEVPSEVYRWWMDEVAMRVLYG